MRKKVKEEKKVKKDTRFKPGVSGNPKGRPKGSYSIVEGLRAKLDEVPQGQKKTYRDLFVEKLMIKALKEGNSVILKDVIDRVDGKAIQRIDHTTDGESFNVPKEIEDDIAKRLKNIL